MTRCSRCVSLFWLRVVLDALPKHYGMVKILSDTEYGQAPPPLFSWPRFSPSYLGRRQRGSTPHNTHKNLTILPGHWTWSFISVPGLNIPTSFCSKSAVNYTRPADYPGTQGANAGPRRVVWGTQPASTLLLKAGTLLPASTLLLPPPPHPGLPHRLAPYCYYTNISTAASFLLSELKTHKTCLAKSGEYNLVS